MRKNKAAFTLIEVMVAVLVISVVIMALLQMKGNSTHNFLKTSKNIQINQYLSFVNSNENFGFENKKTSLDMLVDHYDFDLEYNFKSKLKNTPIELKYKELESIDLSELSEDSPFSLVFEVGSTVLKTDDSSVSIVRVRTQ